MDKDPARRFGSAAAMAAAIAGDQSTVVMAQPSVPTRIDPLVATTDTLVARAAVTQAAVDRPPRVAHRRGALVAIAVVVLAGVLGVMVVVRRSSLPADTPSTQPPTVVSVPTPVTTPVSSTTTAPKKPPTTTATPSTPSTPSTTQPVRGNGKRHVG
jgi:hypothetical protein